MQICPDCKYYTYGSYYPEVPKSCSKGNKEAFDNFWNECGDKTRDDSKSVKIPCFEPTEFAVKTQELIDKTKDVLKYFEDINKVKSDDTN